MRVAVITPYHTEPLDMLRRAHDSVMAQTHAGTHYMVADGHPRDEIDTWNVRHIRLPVEHGNNGNTPRAVGSVDAMGGDFDAVAYLDADNWYEPNHIASLLEHQQKTGADLVTSGRIIHALDETVLLPEGEADDGTRHVDTSALLVMASGFGALPTWATMPDEMGPNCDRVFFHAALGLGLEHTHTSEPTLHFTSRYSPHYRVAGIPVPPDATAMTEMKRSEDFIREMRYFGFTHFLNSKELMAARGMREATPVVFVIIGKEEVLDPDDIALVESLESQIADVETYFADAVELHSEKEITAERRNVFVFVFEKYIEDRATVDRLSERPADLRFIYIRSGSNISSTSVDRLLDRLAWQIVVDSPESKEIYHQNSRYGAGHVIIGSTQQQKIGALTERLKLALR